MSSWLKFVPEILCVQNSINILQNKGKVTRKWREVIFAATSAYPGLGHYQSPLSGMLLLVTAHGLGKERDCSQSKHEIFHMSLVYSQYT